MDRSASLIHLGTHGWELADDHSGFYPEDLPADWRLEYYTTQFHAVELPPLTERPDPDVVAEWHELTLPDARFAVAIGTSEWGQRLTLGSGLRDLAAALEPLGDKLAALLWPAKPPNEAISFWPRAFHLEAGVDTASAPEAPPPAHPAYWRLDGEAAEPGRLEVLADQLAREQAAGRHSFVFFSGTQAATGAGHLAEILARRELA
jgi:hypothetical protein